MGRGKSLFWAPGFAPLILVISVSSANPRSFFYRLWNLHFGAGFRKLFDPLASFLSFDDDALFLKLVSSSFLQQPPPRGAAMFLVVDRKVLWERSEDALAYLLNSPIPRALF